MNIFFVLHYIAVNIYAILIIYLLIKNPRSFLNISIVLLLVSFGIWGLGHCLIYSAETAREAVTGDNIAFFGVATFAPNTLLFSMVFTKTFYKLKKHQLLIIFSLMYTVSVIFIIQQFKGNISVTDIPSEYGWLPRLQDTIWIAFFVFYYLSISFTGMGMIFLHSFKAEDILERKQSFVTFWAFIIPFSISQLTEVIFPLFEIRLIPPLNPVWTVFLAVGIVLAARKYRFLRSFRKTYILIDELRSKKAELKNIIDSLPLMLLVTDIKYKVIHMSRKAEGKLSNIMEKGNSINAENFFVFRNGSSLSYHLYKTLKSEKKRDFECEIIGNSGSVFPASVTASTFEITKNCPSGFVMVIKDISESKEKESIIKKNLLKAKKAEQLIAVFLSNVAQEIYSPVEVIKTHTEMLMNNETDSEKSGMLKHIKTSCEKLMNIAKTIPYK